MSITRVSLLVVAIALLNALSAGAAEERRNDNVGAGAVPEVDYAASKAAQQRLTEARQRSSAADSGLISSVANLRREVEAGAEWQIKEAQLERERQAKIREMEARGEDDRRRRHPPVRIEPPRRAPGGR